MRFELRLLRNDRYWSIGSAKSQKNLNAGACREIEVNDVIAGANGEEGYLLAKREKPDLVMMDVRMGGMTGLETLRRLRQTDAKLPVILMTAYGTTQTAIEAMKLGAFDYLNKSHIDLDYLPIVINNAYERFVLRRANRELETFRERMAADQFARRRGGWIEFEHAACARVLEDVEHRAVALKQVGEEANRLLIHRAAQPGESREVPLALLAQLVEVVPSPGVSQLGQPGPFARRSLAAIREGTGRRAAAAGTRAAADRVRPARHSRSAGDRTARRHGRGAGRGRRHRGRGFPVVVGCCRARRGDAVHLCGQ